MNGIIKILALATLVLVAISCGQHGQDARGYLVKVGDKVPDFTIDFPGGSKQNIADQKGKVVMLQFTASWCSVCRKEMPYIEKDIWQKHKDNKDFVLWGIDREESAEMVRKFVGQMGTTYPIGLDLDASIFGLFADLKAGITRNVIINKEGEIIFLTRLFDKDEFEEMVKVIDRELEK